MSSSQHEKKPLWHITPLMSLACVYHLVQPLPGFLVLQRLLFSLPDSQERRVVLSS